MEKTHCIFCKKSTLNLVDENEHCFVIEDKYPVTPGHSLVIPRRHVSSYFDLSENEILALNTQLKRIKNQLAQKDPSINGFNLGVNIGSDAGQTVLHCHLHLIPRRSGDVDDPVGGVRNTIPGKGNYHLMSC